MAELQSCNIHELHLYFVKYWCVYLFLIIVPMRRQSKFNYYACLFHMPNLMIELHKLIVDGSILCMYVTKYSYLCMMQKCVVILRLEERIHYLHKLT